MPQLLPSRAPAAVLSPIVGALAAARVTPNMLTVAGFLGNVAAAVLVANGQLLVGGILVLLFSALDMLDGALARATGRATPFGALFDSVLDRLSEAAVLGGILVYELDRGNQEETVLAFVAVVGSLMVSYVRARAEGLGVSMTSGLFTRSERVVLTAIALIISPLLRPALWALAAITLVTVAQRVDTARRLLAAAKPAESEER
jgi:CDP-diacylglycerol--glycerol-3-phosphate 3-phosphatidyltransferase